jgi:uncharacterized membrane protein YfcA
MPDVSVTLAFMIVLLGAAAGGMGALLGIGGGVFLVPLLTLFLKVPIQYAIPISLCTVIATSNAVSARTAGRQLINLRLGMVLEVATAVGGLVGGLTSRLFTPGQLHLLFAVVAAGSGLVMLGRLGRRNVSLDPEARLGHLGGRYYEDESGGVVTYRVRRLPLALGASFLAGNISTLLGVGGGIIKVPVLNAWCGVPMRAAAATSAFMIGVTASSGMLIYFGRGQVVAALAAAAVVGVQLGSWAGAQIGERATARWLKLLLAVVLFVVSALMLMRAADA